MPEAGPAERSAYNQTVIDEFRANDGHMGPPFSGTGLLLLTTTGARTRQPRTSPMMFVPVGEPDDGGVMVIASNMGAAVHPAWYRNLVADPVVEVEVPDEPAFAATARTATGDERSTLWTALVASHPFFADHQSAIARQIPLVILERRA